MLLQQIKISKLIYPIVLFGVLVSAEEEETIDSSSGSFWAQIAAIISLVLCSGVVAGLTLGLMSLDTTNLSILRLAGTPQQQKHASLILPIRKNGHILLATLLLTNTVINETIPILFDSIFSKGFISVIVSTALLVLFAEIIPQAIFTKHGLAIGAKLAIPVKILVTIWLVVSWPIAKLLDCILGTHTGIVYNVPELGALVELHDSSKHEGGALKHETVNLLQNILSLQIKCVSQIHQPINSLWLVPSSAVIDTNKIIQHMKEGYSHVLVYVKQDKEISSTIPNDFSIQGVMNLKQLLLIALKQDSLEPIGNMKLEPFLTCSSTTSIVEVMHQLLKSKDKEQVLLIYRTEEEVKKNGEERAQRMQESILAKQATLNSHKRTIQCLIRRFIGSSCSTCHRLSAEYPQLPSSLSFNQNLEEGTVRSTSSLPTTIDAEAELGLIGMLTTADILNQLSLEGPHISFSNQVGFLT